MNKTKVHSRNFIDFFKKELDWPNTITKEIDSETIENGELFTYLPRNTNNEEIKPEYSQGYDLDATSMLFESFASKFLSSDPKSVILRESAIDDFNSKAFNIRNHVEWFRHNSALFYRYKTIKCLDKLTFGRFEKLYFTTDLDTCKAESNISNDAIKFFADELKYIVVSIFDEEGYLIWAKKGTNTSII